jgi:hypothetical protein
MIAWAVVFALMSVLADPPSLPFVDFEASPCEGCIYQKWIARKPVAVYDTWKEGRRQVAQILTGDRVTGITGVVITYRPGLIRMDRDLPEQGLKQGDTIFEYTYRGEGYSGVWFDGRYRPSYDVSFAKRLDGSGCGAPTARLLI